MRQRNFRRKQRDAEFNIPAIDSSNSDFNENWYLTTYPDVAEAVRTGAIESAHEHFLLHGKAEGRAAHPGPGTELRPVAPASAETPPTAAVYDEAVIAAYHQHLRSHR